MNSYGGFEIGVNANKILLEKWMDGGNVINNGNDVTFSQSITADDKELLTNINWCENSEITGHICNEFDGDACYYKDQYYNTGNITLNCSRYYTGYIGVLSIDEIKYAGGVTSLKNNYLYINATSNVWYTSSPYFFNHVWYSYYTYVVNAGNVGYTLISGSEYATTLGGYVSPFNSTMNFRPSVVLDSDKISISGDGTLDSPYEVIKI